MHLSPLRRGSEPQAPVRGAIIIEAIPLTPALSRKGRGSVHRLWSMFRSNRKRYRAIVLEFVAPQMARLGLLLEASIPGT